MIGDGYEVTQLIVPRAYTPTQVKSLINSEYQKNTTDLPTVYILGHVAVPNSGDIYPDGHPDHRGAWPADMYYADVGADAVWYGCTSCIQASIITPRSARQHHNHCAIVTRCLLTLFFFLNTGRTLLWIIEGLLETVVAIACLMFQVGFCSMCHSTSC